MAVEASAQTSSIDGLTLRFCSEQCRATFAAAPARYLPAMGAVPTIDSGAQPVSFSEAAPGAAR